MNTILVVALFSAPSFTDDSLENHYGFDSTHDTAAGCLAEASALNALGGAHWYCIAEEVTE